MDDSSSVKVTWYVNLSRASLCVYVFIIEREQEKPPSLTKIVVEKLNEHRGDVRIVLGRRMSLDEFQVLLSDATEIRYGMILVPSDLNERDSPCCSSVRKSRTFSDVPAIENC